MSEIKDGGPAFPWLAVPSTENNHGGMSLRDYFASKAMHQFLAGARLPDGYDAAGELRLLSARAYEVADAMLEARKA